MKEFDYSLFDKENCWYKDVCNKSMCGDKDFCMRHYKIAYLVHGATLEGKQQYTISLTPDKCDIEAFKHLRDIKNNIESFVQDGKNLLIYSKNTGNGKTQWSKKLLLSWFNSIWNKTDLACRGIFISMPKFIAAMKENISKPNDYYIYVNENIVNADLVIFDEINYKEWSLYEQDYMLSVINQRIEIGKSNIYTTNYDLPTIEERLGTRLSSRIIGCSDLVEFKGSDRRGIDI